MSTFIRDRAYNHIREKLLSGGFAAEARVSEIAISKELGVSKIPVRDAVTQLVGEGLLHRQPGVGAFVPISGRAQIEDLFSLREALESFAAARAVERMTATILRELEDCFQRLLEIGRLAQRDRWAPLDDERCRQALAADQGFHFILLGAAGSPRILQIVRDFGVVSQTFQAERKYPPGTLPRRYAMGVRGHGRVLRAVQRRDPQGARDAMADHIREAKHYALQSFDWK